MHLPKITFPAALTAATLVLAMALALAPTLGCSPQAAATPGPDQPAADGSTTIPSPHDRYLVIYDQGELGRGTLQDKINAAATLGYVLVSLSPMHAASYGYVAVLERSDVNNSPNAGSSE